MDLQKKPGTSDCPESKQNIKLSSAKSPSRHPQSEQGGGRSLGEYHRKRKMRVRSMWRDLLFLTGSWLFAWLLACGVLVTSGFGQTFSISRESVGKQWKEGGGGISLPVHIRSKHQTLFLSQVIPVMQSH